MLPPIQLRCEEQLLSKHRVLGPVLPVNEQQLFEHELSMANAEFHLSAARQSRHALWFDFQSRALVASKGEDETEDGTSGPSMSCRGRQRSFTNWSFDSVRFKVFVVLFLSAMFCPECIQQYSTLPTQAATTLHVRLLTPQGESSDGWELCAASAIAPVFPLDPHSGALLAEVRREHLRFEYTAKLEEHKGMVKLGKSDVVVRPLGHEGAACSSPCSRDDSAKFRRWLIQLYRESEQPVMAT
ncbi:unnamed protein product [Durusdinium trenchii]|uniref:Uncharacterized protein n=2 Tax=Durusdinium trenchii TaxID=1381693 RepID=A0ABP0IW88_9DINO